MIEVPLQYPVKLTETRTIETLEVREEIVFSDWFGIVAREQPTWDDVAVLAGRLTGQPDVVIHKLRWPDQQRLANTIMSFLFPSKESPEDGPLSQTSAKSGGEL